MSGNPWVDTFIAASNESAAPGSRSLSQSSPIFIVGCSRSGTTLLQSILAHHPDIQAFPETNILYEVLNDLDYRRYGSVIGRSKIPHALLGRAINNIGITTKFPWERLRDSTDSQRSKRAAKKIVRARSIRTIFSEFCSMMDAGSGGRRWLEKSPQNIFCLHLISRYIPNARVVHIVRGGRDNVASIIDAASRHGAFRYRFGGKYGLRKAIHYYNACLAVSKRYRVRRNHAVIRYEDLVVDPLRALQPVSRLLNINITKAMLRYDAKGICTLDERWKQHDPQIRPQPNKFDTLFSADEQYLIITKTLDADVLFPRRIPSSRHHS